MIPGYTLKQNDDKIKQCFSLINIYIKHIKYNESVYLLKTGIHDVAYFIKPLYIRLNDISCIHYFKHTGCVNKFTVKRS